MESWISLSLSPFPALPLHLPLSLSLSISPAPSPFVVLILCRASTPTGVWRLPSYRHHYLLQSCTLQNYVLTYSMQYHLLHLPTMSLSIVSPSSRLLSRVLLVNYNTLYMYIQTYILHVHCVYDVHASKRLDLLL